MTIVENEQYIEKWICYGNEYIAAKELTINPNQQVMISDNTAYGCVVVQGYGKIGDYSCSAPTMLRYGGFSEDEFFVSFSAASKGVTIKNFSNTEPLVILKHFPSYAGVPDK